MHWTDVPSGGEAQSVRWPLFVGRLIRFDPRGTYKTHHWEVPAGELRPKRRTDRRIVGTDRRIGVLDGGEADGTCARRITIRERHAEPARGLGRVQLTAGIHCPRFVERPVSRLLGVVDAPTPGEFIIGMLDAFLGMFSRDIGIDLGTANTLVHVRDRGIVISEPSVVAIEARTKRVLAIGAEAKRMLGRTPANIIAIRPLRDGVISDFDVTEQMIKYFVHKVHDRVGLIPRPRMLIGIPSGVTEVEKRAVRDAALNAGARWARLIEEPMAAAIGAGLPVGEPTGSMIVDIGGGTTEVAVISLGGIVVSRSLRIGGDELDQDIISYARREYNLLLGERTAEDIKIAIGSAYPGDYDDQRVTLRGRDLLTGLPRAVEITAEQVREAIESSVQQIVDTIKDTIEETPPELVADIMDQGIVLAGGGALLQGLDRRVSEATQMPVHVADDPLTCVARGTGKALEELDVLERTLVAETYSHSPR
jgi:rod shape-determining protein MreB